MNKYKVEVRGADWKLRKKDAASLLISVGQTYCEGEKLEAAVDWINKNFSECFVDVADTLQRFNYMALENMSPTHAETVAYEAGNIWLKRNEKILKNLSIPFTIRRWDFWRKRGGFNDMLIHAHELYATNKEFKAALDSDIKGFIARRQEDGSITDHKTALRMAECSLQFILEEIAASILIGNIKPASVIYNAKELLSYNAIRTNKIAAPAGLNYLDYIRITFRSRTIQPEVALQAA